MHQTLSVTWCVIQIQCFTHLFSCLWFSLPHLGDILTANSTGFWPKTSFLWFSTSLTGQRVEVWRRGPFVCGCSSSFKEASFVSIGLKSELEITVQRYTVQTDRGEECVGLWIRRIWSFPDWLVTGWPCRSKALWKSRAINGDNILTVGTKDLSFVSLVSYLQEKPFFFLPFLQDYQPWIQN